MAGAIYGTGIGGLTNIELGRGFVNIPQQSGGFNCVFHAKGRSQTRLGMSMSIQRGVGNVGWTREKHQLGIDVTFSIVDLSPLMHIPIEHELNLGDLSNPDAALNKLLTTPTTLTLNMLSAMVVNEQIYTSDKLAPVLAKTKLDVKQWVSPIQMFVQGTDRN